MGAPQHEESPADPTILGTTHSAEAAGDSGGDGGGRGAGGREARAAMPAGSERNGTERNEQRPSPRTARPVEGLNLLARDPSLGQAVYFAMEEKVTRPPSARSFPFLFLLLKKEVIFSPKRPVRSIPSGTDSTALCRQSLTTRVG